MTVGVLPPQLNLCSVRQSKKCQVLSRSVSVCVCEREVESRDKGCAASKARRFLCAPSCRGVHTGLRRATPFVPFCASCSACVRQEAMVVMMMMHEARARVCSPTVAGPSHARCRLVGRGGGGIGCEVAMVWERNVRAWVCVSLSGYCARA